jgi:diadenosine tetraphosphatase ApaH/serine/threonine PP2A family protein phosphatase
LIDARFLKALIEDPHLLSELDLDTVFQILSSVREIFEDEEILLEFDLVDPRKEIYVIGDIHGDLESLIKLYNIFQTKKPYAIIFLGDIVDRGFKQLESLVFILILKILNPNQYYLLKGNHETWEMNQIYGFLEVFTKKFKGGYGFKEILGLYKVLPICAIVNKTVLCLHGGIPQDKDILKKIRNVKTKDIGTLDNFTSQALSQILWNDPKENLKEFTESFRGPGIYFFGEDVFNEFLEENTLMYMIRSHERFPEGYRWFFKNRLLSIFSSINYLGKRNPIPASYAIIIQDKIKPKTLEL